MYKFGHITKEEKDNLAEIDRRKIMETNIYKYSVYGNLKPIMKEVFAWTRTYTANLYHALEDDHLDSVGDYNITSKYLLLNFYPEWVVVLVLNNDPDIIKISLWAKLGDARVQVKNFLFDRARFGTFGRLGDDLMSYQRKLLAGKEDQYTKHINRVFENYSAELNRIINKIRLNCVKRLDKARLDAKKTKFLHRIFDNCIDLLVQHPNKYTSLRLTQRNLRNLENYVSTGKYGDLSDEDIRNLAKNFLGERL